MTDPEHDPSIRGEPHLRQGPFAPDPSDDRATRDLARERAATDPHEERAKHSVFDEPAVLPHREPVLIDQDWTCRNCGYNLRGLMTGHPCPECGAVERYEPPREGELTHAKWLAEHRSRRPAGQAWLAAVAVPLLGVPWALACALLLVEYSGLTGFVVFGPVAAEIAKVAAALMLIERRSRLIHRPAQVYLMTLGTAVVFAAVQNLLYLYVYFKNSPVELIAWRWTVCPILHGICACVATRGLVAVWEAAEADGRRPGLQRAYPHVTAAILLHAAHNAVVFALGRVGYGL